jgi:hypothetical protein
VSLAAPGFGYLDELFAAIRGFARELAAARGALERAREAPASSAAGGASRASASATSAAFRATGAASAASPWRFQTLGVARASLNAAGACLAEVEERLRDLGAPGDIPPPLDQLPKNLAAMRADLEAEEANFASLAREMAARPLGQG